MLRLVCGSGVKPNGEPMTFNDYVANFEKLTTIQKAEIFESGIAETEGDDLDQVLWLKSPNSEVNDTTRHATLPNDTTRTQYDTDGTVGLA
jgi:hypothetical protein